jgi:uncharacterized protein
MKIANEYTFKKYNLCWRLISMALVISSYPSLVSAQNQNSNIMENKKLIQQGFENWAKGTGSFFDLLADNVQWTITGSTPLSKTYTSKKQFMAEVIAPLNDRLFKKIVPKVSALYADGDMVIAIWDGRATAIDGKPYNATYEWNMQIKNGKIVKVTAFLDEIEFSDIMTRL